MCLEGCVAVKCLVADHAVKGMMCLWLWLYMRSRTWLCLSWCVLLGDCMWVRVSLSCVQHVLCLFLVSLSLIVTEERIMVVARDATDNAGE